MSANLKRNPFDAMRAAVDAATDALNTPPLHPGYWFCFICKIKIVPDVDHEFNRCPHCQQPRIKWFPPL